MSENESFLLFCFLLDTALLVVEKKLYKTNEYSIVFCGH